jgi:hypothetical protein
MNSEAPHEFWNPSGWMWGVGEHLRAIRRTASTSVIPGQKWEVGSFRVWRIKTT